MMVFNGMARIARETTLVSGIHSARESSNTYNIYDLNGLQVVLKTNKAEKRRFVILGKAT